jgi:hypothetical protein
VRAPMSGTMRRARSGFPSVCALTPLDRPSSSLTLGSSCGCRRSPTRLKPWRAARGRVPGATNIGGGADRPLVYGQSSLARYVVEWASLPGRTYP